MLLALFTCIGPVEAVAPQSAGALLTAVRASLAQHWELIIGLLVLVALRAMLRMTTLMLKGPPMGAAPSAPAVATHGILPAVASAFRLVCIFRLMQLVCS